ncbi:MFS transporter [Streptomyces sp. NPDC012888]|uniref:MFS transporter n=1 Tax=Streptomyces sp. NPDC012888 TaxID=3364855 RepID=UPI00367B52A0
MNETISAAAVPPGRASRRRWLALAVVGAAMFLDTLDASIVTVVLPAIQTDLDGGYAMAQWTLAGYTLAFGLLLITGGRLGDVFGRKRVFMAGVAGFTVASVVCGLSVNGEMLVAGRFAQGLMAALMVPQTMAVVVTLFRKEEWANAFTLVGVGLIVGSVSGPLLGGVLTELDLLGLGWRAIFLINVPLGLLTLLLAVFFVPESRSEEPLRVDVLGVVLLAAAAVGVLYPLVQGREEGWPVWMFAVLAAGLVLLVVFAGQQRSRHRRDGSALIPPPLFRPRSFRVGLTVTLLFYTGISSFFLVLTYHLQFGLGWSVWRTALATSAWPLAIIAATQVSWRVKSVAGRTWVGVGSLVLAAGVLCAIVSVRVSGAGLALWQVSLAGVVMGLGMGLCSPVLTAVVLGDVPPKDSGVGSGVVNAFMQLGSAVGIAVVGLVFFGLVGGDGDVGLDGGRDGSGGGAVVGDALAATLWYNVAAFLLTALLSRLLPGSAGPADGAEGADGKPVAGEGVAAEPVAR